MYIVTHTNAGLFFHQKNINSPRDKKNEGNVGVLPISFDGTHLMPTIKILIQFSRQNVINIMKV